MNYDAELTRIIEAAKRDPDMHVKWRNKGISKLDEAQALFSMGKRMTMLQPPEGYQAEVLKAAKQPILGSDTQWDFSKTAAEQQCICLPGGKHKDCPVHGWQA